MTPRRNQPITRPATARAATSGPFMAGRSAGEEVVRRSWAGGGRCHLSHDGRAGAQPFIAYVRSAGSRHLSVRGGGTYEPDRRYGAGPGPRGGRPGPSDRGDRTGGAGRDGKGGGSTGGGRGTGGREAVAQADHQ